MLVQQASLTNYLKDALIIDLVALEWLKLRWVQDLPKLMHEVAKQHALDVATTTTVATPVLGVVYKFATMQGCNPKLEGTYIISKGEEEDGEEGNEGEFDVGEANAQR